MSKIGKKKYNKCLENHKIKFIFWDKLIHKYEVYILGLREYQIWKKEVLCTSLRPIMLYGSKCWGLKGHELRWGQQRLQFSDECGYTSKDNIHNDLIRERFGVAS